MALRAAKIRNLTETVSLSALIFNQFPISRLIHAFVDDALRSLCFISGRCGRDCLGSEDSGTVWVKMGFCTHRCE